MELVPITPPAAEPVLVTDLLNQLGLVMPSDAGLAAALTAGLTGKLVAARADCENYTRLAFITQTWGLKCDSFPGRDFRYLPTGYAALLLPKPPLQSIASFQYVDTAGQLQTLLQETTYGVDPAAPIYGYQLDRGGEEQPSKLIVSYPKVWPPTRMVPSNVLVKFRCGYGGPLTVSTTANSAVIAGPKFNPDDASLLPLETGLAVSIPGAGPVVGGNATALVTNIASVDGNGQATLATAATAAVMNAPGWFGAQVPQPILQAILFLAQWYYEQASVVDAPLPRVVRGLLDPYRNLVA
jgi:hypothetical protein